MLTSREAANVLRVGVREIRTLIDTGQLAGTRLGPRKVIRVSRAAGRQTDVAIGRDLKRCAARPPVQRQLLHAGTRTRATASSRRSSSLC